MMIAGPYAGFEHVELTIGHGGTMSAHYEQWFRERGGTDDMLLMDNDPPEVHHCSGTRTLPIALHPTTFITERSTKWLRERADDGQQFFTHISFPDPHHPFDPPEEACGDVAIADEPAPIVNQHNLEDRPEHYAANRDGTWARKGRKPDRPKHRRDR